MSAEQIRIELEAAKKIYNSLQLTTFSAAYDTKLVELTFDNVANVETMIRIDSKYAPSNDYNNDKYLPYWMLELGKHLGHPNNDEPVKEEFDTVVKKVVERVDIENSTHLNADHCGREWMEGKISELKEQEKLLEYLEKPEHKFDLIGILSARTKPGKGGRCNISFASKFCHYACFYIFEGEAAQDNFSIYDSVVAKILPYYLDYYRDKIKLKKEFKPASKDYEIYSEAIDAVIEASGSKISRHGFDHLLWYYFKDRELPKTKKGKR